MPSRPQPVRAAIQYKRSRLKEAIYAVFPQTEIQRCIIHQIRHSLQYVAWKDRKAFVADLKAITLLGQPEHHQQVDNADAELGQHLEPVSDSVCGTLAHLTNYS